VQLGNDVYSVDATLEKHQSYQPSDTHHTPTRRLRLIDFLTVFLTGLRKDARSIKYLLRYRLYLLSTIPLSLAPFDLAFLHPQSTYLAL
jgi:hypothetical protein